MNKADEIAEWTSPKRAAKIVQRALDLKMRPEEIAVELGVSVSVFRTWENGTTEQVRPKTARQLRRLERRLAK